MVFMNAKNNLEPWAISNLQDMIDASGNNEINIVVALGRLGANLPSVGSWSGTYLFKVTPNLVPITTNAIPNVTGIGGYPDNVDMGTAEAVLEFVQFAMSHYPAQHYMLIMWGHGMGWRAVLAKETFRELLNGNSYGAVAYAKPNVSQWVPSSSIYPRSSRSTTYSGSSGSTYSGNSASGSGNSASSNAMGREGSSRFYATGPGDTASARQSLPTDEYHSPTNEHSASEQVYVTYKLVSKKLGEPQTSYSLPLPGGQARVPQHVMRVRTKEVPIGIATPVAIDNGFLQAPPVRAISPDDVTGHHIDNRELEDALKKAVGQDHLDVLGFDACLMAMAEVDYAFRDEARYLLASEEEEPDAGWAYKPILKFLNKYPNAQPSSVSSAIVSAYRDKYMRQGKATLSAFSLADATKVANSVDTLTGALLVNLPKNVALIGQTRASLPSYGNQDSAYFPYVDLRTFANGLLDRHPNAAIAASATAVAKAVTSGIAANFASPDRIRGFGSRGVAIYFPTNLATFEGQPAYQPSNKQPHPVEFVLEHNWSKFLLQYLSYTANLKREQQAPRHTVGPRQASPP